MKRRPCLMGPNTFMEGEQNLSGELHRGFIGQNFRGDVSVCCRQEKQQHHHNSPPHKSCWSVKLCQSRACFALRSRASAFKSGLRVAQLDEGLPCSRNRSLRQRTSRIFHRPSCDQQGRCRTPNLFHYGLEAQGQPPLDRYQLRE